MHEKKIGTLLIKEDGMIIMMMMTTMTTVTMMNQMESSLIGDVKKSKSEIL